MSTQFCHSSSSSRCTNHTSSPLASRTLSVAVCVGNKTNTASENRMHCTLSLVAPYHSTPDTPHPMAASGKFNIPSCRRVLRASESFWRFYRVRTHPFTPTRRGLKRTSLIDFGAPMAAEMFPVRSSHSVLIRTRVHSTLHALQLVPLPPCLYQFDPWRMHVPSTSSCFVT